MMKRGWLKECTEYLQLNSETVKVEAGVLVDTDKEEPFNLVFRYRAAPAVIRRSSLTRTFRLSATYF
jgi:hypothetical protein